VIANAKTIHTKVLAVGDWTPDMPDLGGNGITAQNVIPWQGAYRSFPSLVAQTNALNARCQGAAFGKDTAGNIYNFAGTISKLYQQAPGSSSYVDSTRTVGGAYGVSASDAWEFAQWGNTMIATDGADAPQVVTLGGANFAALAGTPPKARHIGIVRDFVVLGNCDDGTPRPNRVSWSAINNSGDWTIAANTQCDIQDLQGDGGWVQKIVGGEYGLVFQERAVWKMTYIGSPVIFQFDLIERSRGAFASQSVIGWGNMVFFLAEDGFYMILGGAAAVPIGAGKVDTTFLADLRTAYAYRVNAAIDPTNKLVMWAYPGSGSTDGTCNKIIIYNWAAKRWAIVVGLTLEVFLRWAATGYSLESLDSVSTSVDALADSLDSRAWVGGAQNLAAFETDHKAYTFTGTAMDATVDTGEVQLTPGMRSSVLWARPLTDGSAATVTLRTRDRQADTATYGSASTQDSSGVCALRSNARYHSARMATTGAFNFIQGVELDFSSEGER
jgi:hypothetical protein